MSKLQQAKDVAEGQKLLDQLNEIGARSVSSTQAIATLAVDYDSWRSTLPAEDVTTADASFAEAAATSKAVIDALAPAHRAWVDQFIAALGYTKN